MLQTAASLVRGRIEARTAAVRAPARESQGRSGTHGGDALDLATAPIQTRTVHAERTMCDRSKACSKARSWRDGEPLVGLISRPPVARPWAWSWQVRGRAQVTRWAGGSHVVRTRPRTSASILQDEQRAWCGAGLSAHRGGASRPARAISGSLGKAMVVTGSTSPRPRSGRTVTICRPSPGRGKMTRNPVARHEGGPFCSTVWASRRKALNLAGGGPTPRGRRGVAAGQPRPPGALCDQSHDPRLDLVSNFPHGLESFALRVFDRQVHTLDGAPRALLAALQCDLGRASTHGVVGPDLGPCSEESDAERPRVECRGCGVRWRNKEGAVPHSRPALPTTGFRPDAPG